MRRRSGAIYSETEEQFLQLAQQSLTTTGLFYDDKLYEESKRRDENIAQDRKLNAFENFDYKAEDELQKDEETLNRELINYININNVIICDQTSDISEILNPEQKKEVVEVRNLDLVVRRSLDRMGNIIVFKYWLVRYQSYTQCLSQVYISAARTVYWTSRKTQSPDFYAIQCSVEELKSKIEENEDKSKGSELHDD